MTPHRPLLAPAPFLTPPRARPAAQRGGPHRLVVAAVLLAAVLGGAQLASLATRGDTDRLILAPISTPALAPQAEAAKAPEAAQGAPAPSPAPSPH